MSYLEIVKQLEQELSGKGQPEGAREPDRQPTAAVGSQPNTRYEIDEKDERNPMDGLPPLGRKNAMGAMVLTLEDLPGLEKRLRLQGWNVRRHGDELICTSPGELRIQ